MKDFHPNILAILPGFIPSTFINVINPLLKLHRSGHINAKIDLELFLIRNNIKKSDLVIFCRNTEPNYGFILNFLLNHRIPFIYDIDDNFYEMPIDSEVGKYHRAPGRLAMLTCYIKSASLVRVYSSPLFERAKALNLNVEMVSAPIDLSLVSPPRATLNRNRVKIVYATSRIEDELSKIFMPALERILTEYSGKVEFHFWGPKLSALESLPGVYYHKPILHYGEFLRNFSKGGFDIGLAPLRDDTFHRSKTNNKFREYGACQIAGIYSDVEVYSNCVTNNETGLLTSNQPQSWSEAIVRLIENDNLREHIKVMAHRYVQRCFSQANFEKVWLQQIQQILKERATSPVLNAFHPETTIRSGGLRFIGTLRETHNMLIYIKQCGLSDILRITRGLLFNIWTLFRLRFLFFFCLFRNFIKK